MAAIETPCMKYDPELWWPLSYTASTLPQINQAKALCYRCDIRTECLERAMGRGEREGIWGGYTPEQRWELLRARNRRAMAALA